MAYNPSEDSSSAEQLVSELVELNKARREWPPMAKWLAGILGSIILMLIGLGFSHVNQPHHHSSSLPVVVERIDQLEERLVFRLMKLEVDLARPDGPYDRFTGSQARALERKVDQLLARSD